MDLDFTKGHIFMEARVSDSMMKKVVFFSVVLLVLGGEPQENIFSTR